MDTFGYFWMYGGTSGQFVRSIWDGRGILVFWGDQFFESLRSWNIVVTPQNTDCHPCTPAPDIRLQNVLSFGDRPKFRDEYTHNVCLCFHVSYVIRSVDQLYSDFGAALGLSWSFMGFMHSHGLLEVCQLLLDTAEFSGTSPDQTFSRILRDSIGKQGNSWNDWLFSNSGLEPVFRTLEGS